MIGRRPLFAAQAALLAAGLSSSTASERDLWGEENADGNTSIRISKHSHARALRARAKLKKKAKKTKG